MSPSPVVLSPVPTGPLVHVKAANASKLTLPTTQFVSYVVQICSAPTHVRILRNIEGRNKSPQEAWHCKEQAQHA